MPEKLYTIPVNEAFDRCALSPETAGEEAQRQTEAAARAAAGCGCPFCHLYMTLEEQEVERILGASMMEPDVRIRTNEEGFCLDHYARMLGRRNRLGLALILESHMETLQSDLQDSAVSQLLHRRGTAASERIHMLEQRCYLCNRIEATMSKMMENAVYLWESDSAFRAKLDAQPAFCLPHYRALLECGRTKLSKKAFSAFREALTAVMEGYFNALRSDTAHFIQKFDYRYEAEPWGNARDAVERAVKFLCGDRGEHPKK